MATTPTTAFGNIPLGTTMATAAETASIASEAAQAAVASITTDLENLISKAYKVKGTKTNYSDLPAWNAAAPNTPENGDVWNVTNANGNIPAGTNYVFVEVLTNGTRTGGSWDAIGGTIDLSAYVKGVKLPGMSSALTPDQDGNVSINAAVGTSDGGQPGVMSISDKDKLDGIPSGAQVNVLEGVKLAGAGSALTPTSKVVTIPNAVATGTTGATNGLMTADDKAKLNGVAAGAQVNTIESVKVNGTALTPTSKAVNIPKATGSVFGAVELSDATDGTAAAASGGTAATPKAVADALAAAKSYADSLPSGGVTSVNGETGSVLIYGNTLVMSNADPTLISAAINNALQTANGAGGEAAIRIKKATVKGKIDTPPSTLENLPSNAANLTLNQILNALYAGASEA